MRLSSRTLSGQQTFAHKMNTHAKPPNPYTSGRRALDRQSEGTATQSQGTGNRNSRPTIWQNYALLLVKAPLENKILVCWGTAGTNTLSSGRAAAFLASAFLHCKRKDPRGVVTTWTLREEVVCGSRGASSCLEPRTVARWSQESVMLEPAHLAVLGLSSERQQGDKDSTFQAPYPSPSQETEEMVVSRLALGPKLTQRKGGRAPLPLPGRKESGEIVLHCELETRGCPWQKAHQIDHSWAGPLVPPPTAPPPPPPQKHLRNPSQPVTGQYSSSRTLPSCPNSWSLLSWMKSEVSTNKGASAPPCPQHPPTHTRSRPQLLRALPLPPLP
ncbi:hypothetical protein mRhiFer1_009079 [Rhinolophus ferrumequinum]|uniref:Uncharacterized protein n=1 Tax=Rhinolophus ferrumequinum TaxID=59479 RepID=A0A7J7SXJ6_RHIFE|nr:hypothetical protein mRhiFer1_009079 [Rhinolophus ferrumequinum]